MSIFCFFPPFSMHIRRQKNENHIRTTSETNSSLKTKRSYYWISGFVSSFDGSFISLFHGWASPVIGSSIPPLPPTLGVVKASSPSSTGGGGITPFVLVNWAFSNLNEQQHQFVCCLFCFCVVSVDDFYCICSRCIIVLDTYVYLCRAVCVFTSVCLYGSL